jgi:hypothetical protein
MGLDEHLPALKTLYLYKSLSMLDRGFYLVARRWIRCLPIPDPTGRRVLMLAWHRIGAILQKRGFLAGTHHTRLLPADTRR